MNRHLKLALEKFNNKEFFVCHDILEDYWFECKQDEKDLYRGLLHYAVAFHHLLDKNNPAGAKLQFTKCIERLKNYDKPYKGIDLRKIIKYAHKNLNSLNNNRSEEIKHVKINAAKNK